MQATVNRTKSTSLPGVTPLRVLLVEDEFVVANDLQLMLEKAGYIVTGIADSVEEARILIGAEKPDMILLDIYLKGDLTGIDLANELTHKQIPFIYISANSNEGILEEAKVTQPYGFIVKPFRQKDVLTTLEIATYRYAHSLEVRLREEKSLQIALTDAISTNESWDQKWLHVARLLQPHIPFDYVLISLEKAGETPDDNGYYRTGFDEYQTILVDDFCRMSGLKPETYGAARSATTPQQAAIFAEEDIAALRQQQSLSQLIVKTFRLQAHLALPIQLAKDGILTLFFFSRHPDTYRPEHMALLERMEQSLALSVDRVLAYESVEKLSEKLKNENIYLQEEVKTAANFEEIIGTSTSLLQVFTQISQVAPTDTSVLILGESGTGKELFARAVHNLSPRRNNLLMKVNCAALPAQLIESELFGHEKGAFTGATDRRIGKFELAHGGTVFLDEVGEIPLELQVKLLRVLQEREIERLGGKSPIKIDVRVIAATNRDLENEVSEGRFRLDLYYRLSVFPVTLPPLRNRREDIPLLANFFVQRFSKKVGKPFMGFHESALQAMSQYEWPGNIRELENVIEQSVILASGQGLLELGRPLVTRVSTKNVIGQDQPDPAPRTLTDVRQLQQETEREYILSVLKRTNGRIRGRNGAAEILNLKPTTLESRMQRLGISKDSVSI